MVCNAQSDLNILQIVQRDPLGPFTVTVLDVPFHGELVGILDLPFLLLLDLASGAFYPTVSVGVRKGNKTS